MEIFYCLFIFVIADLNDYVIVASIIVIAIRNAINCAALYRKSMVHQNCCFPHSSEYLPLCSAEQRHSYRFGTTWPWVNYDRIFSFGWTIPLTLSTRQRLVYLTLTKGDSEEGMEWYKSKNSCKVVESKKAADERKVTKLCLNSTWIPCYCSKGLFEKKCSPRLHYLIKNSQTRNSEIWEFYSFLF